MDTDEIRCALSNLIKKPFVVIARDELPFVDVSRLPLSIVVNTDASSGKGVHWCGFYVTRINSKIVGYFFDSYANNYKYYNFEPPFTVKYSSKKVLQPDDSATCGLWTIAWLVHMCKYRSIRSFESKFTNNLKKNDSILTKKYSHIQHICCFRCVPRIYSKY